MEPKIYGISGGEITVWAEPGVAVMVKFAADRDPVELGEGELEELLEILTKLRAAVR